MVEKLNVRYAILAPMVPAIVVISFATAPVYGQAANRAQRQIIPLGPLLFNFDCAGKILIDVSGYAHFVTGHFRLERQVSLGSSFKLQNSMLMLVPTNALAAKASTSGVHFQGPAPTVTCTASSCSSPQFTLAGLGQGTRTGSLDVTAYLMSRNKKDFIVKGS